MKKMLLATALALLITGCAQQTFTVQNKPAAVAPKETITHHFFVSGIGQKKTVDAAKICGGAENVVKTGNPANIRKWIARFYYFRHLYSAGSTMCIAHNNCMSCPSIWATLSALLINILLGSFQLFLQASASPRGASSTFSRSQSVLSIGWKSGRLRTADQTAMCGIGVSGISITRASFSTSHQLNSFVYFASSAATSR